MKWPALLPVGDEPYYETQKLTLVAICVIDEIIITVLVWLQIQSDIYHII